MEIATQKHELRLKMKGVMKALPLEEKIFGGRAIALHVVKWLDAFKFNLGSAAIFKNFGDEIHTTYLDEVLQSRGVNRAVACTDDNQQLAYYSLSHDEGMASTSAKAEIFAPNNASFDIIFMPGLAFDNAGHRLGRGHACFDRALADINSWPKRPILIAILLDEQMVKSVPHEAHDVVVDFLCTPKRGLIRSSPRDRHV